MTSSAPDGGTEERMVGVERGSIMLGAGTLASRVTGLLRTVVLVGVVGSNRSAVADAFSVANQLPNSICGLISVGILTAVIVPQIVRASRRQDGEEFVSKLVTMGGAIFLLMTGAAVVVAPWLVSLQLRPENTAQIALATAFAYWCLPQIFFYGLYALLGEVLNAKGIFGPFAWAPVANNIFSIIGFLLIGMAFGENLARVAEWSPGMIASLGGVATGGIALQALVLLLFWRRTGIRLEIDFRWRGAQLGDLGRVASWTLLMALVSLGAGFYQSWVANEASGQGAASAVMSNAWLVFMLPYSIIVLSIGTPYYTRLSEHASLGAYPEMRRDISRSIRTLGFFLFAALAALVAAAVPASRVFTNSPHDAAEASLVLCCYLLSLVPLAVLFIVQRTFYAVGDTRTPFWFTLFQTAVVIATASLAWLLHELHILPVTSLAAAVALGQSVASIGQSAIAVVLLRRRLGGLHVQDWVRPLARCLLAAVPATLAGWALYLALGGQAGWFVSDKLPGVLGTIAIGLLSGAVYVSALAMFRAPELAAALALIRARFPRRFSAVSSDDATNRRRTGSR